MYVIILVLLPQYFIQFLKLNKMLKKGSTIFVQSECTQSVKTCSILKKSIRHPPSQCKVFNLNLNSIDDY